MSGATIGGVVGAVVGAFFGNPQLGWMIGSAIGGYVDPEQIEGPKLRDARTQTARDGVAIPFGWGTFPLAGNIIWQGPVVEHKSTETQGKGGPEVTSYTYTRSYAIGMCEGPITGLLQIKRNGKLVYDARDDETLEEEYTAFGLAFAEAWEKIAGVRAENTKFIDRCVTYLGDETQTPDPTMEAIDGVGEVPAYRGLAYIVVTDDDVTDIQGAIPQYEFVVAACGTSEESAGTGIADWFIAQSRISGSALAPSADGADWAAFSTINFTQGFNRVHATQNRLILWCELADMNPYYTDDRGATLHELPYAGSISGGLFGATQIGTRLWIPGGLYGLHYTDDEGDNWDNSPRATNAVFGAVNDFFIAGHEGLMIRGGSGGSMSTYDEGAAAWGPSLRPFEPAVHPNLRCGASDGTTVVVGGDSNSLLWTTDGATYTNCTLPGLSSGIFYQVIAPTNGSEKWMAFRSEASDTSSAILLSLDGQTWTAASGYSAFTITGGGQTAYRKDGRVTVIGESSTDVQVILTTTDEGATWTDCADTIPDANALAAISGPPAQWAPPSNSIAIPDAPGWYTDADGVIHGPGGVVVVTPCEGVPLSTIVADLCDREGLTSDEYDVTQLEDDLVPGFRVANEGGADSAISALMPAYFFDVAEWDGKVRFIKRGGTAVAALNGDDLVERDGDAFERERVQEAELLRRVTVGYIDPAAAYGPTTQKWERRAGTVQARGEASMELPLTLAGDTAASIAKKRGLTAWGEPEKQKFSLPYRLAALTPTDVLTYTDDDGEVHTLRLMNAEDDGGIRYMESSINSAEAYGATATGVSAKPPTINANVGLRGPTVLHAMNLDSLRAQDNVPGMYIAVTGVLAGWQGCTVEMSKDGGVSFTPVLTVTTPAKMGYLTSAATTSSEPIQVFLYAGAQLASVTLEQIANGFNAFAMTTGGGVSELSQFQTATAVSSGNYDLTDVTRGVRDTVPASHAIRDAFVLLDSAVQFLPVDVALAGQTLVFRAVTLGTSSDAADTVSVVYEPPTFVLDGGGA